MRTRPKAVAFDVVETLFALEPMRGQLLALGLPGQALEIWFARLLRNAFALDTAGTYKPFTEVARGTLDALLSEFGLSTKASALERALAGLSELPVHADVAPAFQMLRGNRVRIVALTNGGADTTRKLLQRARLDGLVERVISIDEVRRWKPSREVYLHAARVMGVAPEKLALVAAHAWDVHGASQAGLATGWVSRLEKRFPPTHESAGRDRRRFARSHRALAGSASDDGPRPDRAVIQSQASNAKQNNRTDQKNEHEV